MVDARPDPRHGGPRGRDPRLSGGDSHARRLATGTLVSQVAQATQVVGALVVATVLGRELTLQEFGVYGLTLSFVGYLGFVQSSVSGTAVKSLAEALDERTRARALTSAVVLYAGFGLIAALIIAGAGTAALGLFDVHGALRGQARHGFLALGVVTLVGWPLRAWRDLLVADQRFMVSALADTIVYVLWAAAITVLALVAHVDLWILILVTGLTPLVSGLLYLLLARRHRLQYRIRPSAVDRAYFRGFAAISAYSLGLGAVDIVIYSLDRVVLAAFTGAAAIGLYEAAVRPHNLVRTLNSSLVVTVLPASARFLAEGDRERVRELVLRGGRYVVAATVPFVLVFMVLARPILEVWVGSKFAPAATAMTVLISYWIMNASLGPAAVALFAAGKAREIAILAWATALINLAVSLALTPSMGLNGVVIGTVAGYALTFVPWLRFTTRFLPVTYRDYWREIVLPPLALGVPLAAALLIVRVAIPLENVAVVASVAVGAVALYFVAYWAFAMDANERALARSLVRPASGSAEG
ncbi:MAG: hypothetical protein QOJ29_2904 [Thermoleophilaceae bacterium]|nr:hypothetical protein [Thermoleophilaceae bacterium]